jgi:hypothetical protein
MHKDVYSFKALSNREDGSIESPNPEDAFLKAAHRKMGGRNAFHIQGRIIG